MRDWRQRVDRELEIAEAARARGNEGMARVCARRAAGWTVQAYLEQRGIDLESPSVLDQFDFTMKLDDLTSKAREILEHLRKAKVQDEAQGESYWPLDVDLVTEAKTLVSELFPKGT